MGLITNLLSKIPIIKRFFGTNKSPQKQNIKNKKSHQLQRQELEMLSSSEADLKNYAHNFSQFIEDWKKISPQAVTHFINSENLESLEAVFLKVKPATENGYKIPAKLLKKYGLETIHSAEFNYQVIYNPELVNKVLDHYPEVFSHEKAARPAIAETLSAVNFKENEIEKRDNYWMRFGLLMGFPLEACEGFIQNHHLEVNQYLDKLFKLNDLNNIQQGFSLNLKSFKKILKQINQEAFTENKSKILSKLKELLIMNIERIKNISKIQSPGVQWLPYGKVTEQSTKLIENMKRAFHLSGILKPKALFSKRVIESYKAKLTEMNRYLEQLDTHKATLLPHKDIKQCYSHIKE